MLNSIKYIVCLLPLLCLGPVGDAETSGSSSSTDVAPAGPIMLEQQEYISQHDFNQKCIQFTQNDKLEGTFSPEALLRAASGELKTMKSLCPWMDHWMYQPRPLTFIPEQNNNMGSTLILDLDSSKKPPEIHGFRILFSKNSQEAWYEPSFMRTTDPFVFIEDIVRSTMPSSDKRWRSPVIISPALENMLERLRTDRDQYGLDSEDWYLSYRNLFNRPHLFNRPDRPVPQMTEAEARELGFRPEEIADLINESDSDYDSESDSYDSNSCRIKNYKNFFTFSYGTGDAEVITYQAVTLDKIKNLIAIAVYTFNRYIDIKSDMAQLLVQCGRYTDAHAEDQLSFWIDEENNREISNFELRRQPGAQVPMEVEASAMADSDRTQTETSTNESVEAKEFTLSFTFRHDLNDLESLVACYVCLKDNTEVRLEHYTRNTWDFYGNLEPSGGESLKESWLKAMQESQSLQAGIRDERLRAPPRHRFIPIVMRPIGRARP